MEYDLEQLFAGLQKGDKRSGSQMMSLLENEGPESETALKRLYAMGGKAFVVGVTGWPGVGKSSLINRVAKTFLDEGKLVAIIAIDPTSPFSGGGLLGDRIRFKEIDGKENLFIRSVASRGHQGGLSRAARGFIKIMEAMGHDVILLETVGIGQDQVTVSLVADTTVVVVAPGLGDYLQAIKSGIMEVGDIFVVNKADRDDADRTVVDLEMAIRMGDKDGWRPPVIKTIASDGTGIEALMTEIARHGASCVAEKMSGQKARAVQNEILEAVKSRLFSRFCGTERLGDESMARFTRDVCERRIDPYMVADMILAEKGIG